MQVQQGDAVVFTLTLVFLHASVFWAEETLESDKQHRLASNWDLIDTDVFDENKVLSATDSITKNCLILVNCCVETTKIDQTEAVTIQPSAPLEPIATMLPTESKLITCLVQFNTQSIVALFDTGANKNFIIKKVADCITTNIIGQTDLDKAMLFVLANNSVIHSQGKIYPNFTIAKKKKKRMV